MDIQSLPAFHVIGIAVRTTNQDEQSRHDMAALWHRFMEDNVAGKIPNATDSTVYCLYTDYEKDFMAPYTAIIGCRVISLQEIPEGFTGTTIAAGRYAKRTVRGDLLQGLLLKEWKKIWSEDWPRAYTSDFEVYSEKAQNPHDAEVDIFLAVTV